MPNVSNIISIASLTVAIIVMVTNIKRNNSIDNSMFRFCYSLTNITIPSTVTGIGNNVFYNCYGLGFIKFTGSTPPTVSGTNAWANIPSDCIIYVPTGSLSTYTSNNKYPSSSTYTYIEY